MILFQSLNNLIYPIRVLWEAIRLKMQWSAEGITYNVVLRVLNKCKEELNNNNSTNFVKLLKNAKRVLKTTDSDLEMSATGDLMVKTSDDTDGVNALNEHEVVSNALLFMMASYETTAVTLQFVIHNLVNHQNVQEQLRSELLKKQNSGVFTLDTLSDFKLLDNVINETLRMYPPVAPFTARIASQDYVYEGIRIPKGTGIYIGVTHIHNDSKLWSEPGKFKPERFESKYDKLSFLGFGGGPRNCIGMRFAYAELKLVIANMLTKYRLLPGPSTETDITTWESYSTMTPKNGVFCKVERL